MKYSKDCFGSRLDINILSGDIKHSVITECFQMVEDFENTYSRFKKGNFLETINSVQQTQIPQELSSLLELCLKVSRLTEGYFDITLLPLLENTGYGISQEEIIRPTGYENIELKGNILTLRNDVTIELGAVGKGYIIDTIYHILKKNSSSFVIDFGGDIRVKGAHTIHLEDPGENTKNIGNIQLVNMAIASSSGNKRKFSQGHHLMNPKKGESQGDKIAVYVTHKLGVFADIFSTALFVTPLKKSLEILEKTPGLEALIIGSDGKIFKSQGFNCILNV